MQIKYKVEKILDGYSICFRQWQAAHSHCKYLHGYAIQFKLHFEANTLDKHNWVWDFGWLKNPNLKIDNMSVSEWFDYMFDHTVLVAHDDPELLKFQNLAQENIIQLRVVPQLSCEKIAQLVLEKITILLDDVNKTNNKTNNYSGQNSNQQIRLTRVDVFEHAKNCASAIAIINK